MTYDIYYSFSVSSFANRQLSHTILKFTAGVRKIESAQIRYTQSPYLVNTVLSIKIYKDLTDNTWCLKITGMDNNLYSVSYNWIIRMRFYPNANNLIYTSTTYASNGEVESSNGDDEYLVGDSYSGSPIAPTKFELQEQRYVAGYYELSRKWRYAKAASTTNRLAFRFTAPYTISEV